MKIESKFDIGQRIYIIDLGRNRKTNFIQWDIYHAGHVAKIIIEEEGGRLS